MKHLKWLIIVIFCSASVVLGSTDIEDHLIDKDTTAVQRIRKDLRECIQKGKARQASMGELRACIDKPYLNSQKELDSVLDKAVKVLNKKKYEKTLEGALAENELNALLKSQSEFKKSIEAKCLYRSMSFNGGSGQGSVESHCLLTLTLDRINEIQVISLDHP